jgi:hypothetical protein
VSERVAGDPLVLRLTIMDESFAASIAGAGRPRTGTAAQRLKALSASKAAAAPSPAGGHEEGGLARLDRLSPPAAAAQVSPLDLKTPDGEGGLARLDRLSPPAATAWPAQIPALDLKPPDGESRTFSPSGSETSVDPTTPMGASIIRHQYSESAKKAGGGGGGGGGENALAAGLEMLLEHALQPFKVDLAALHAKTSSSTSKLEKQVADDVLRNNERLNTLRCVRFPLHATRELRPAPSLTVRAVCNLPLLWGSQCPA